MTPLPATRGLSSLPGTERSREWALGPGAGVGRRCRGYARLGEKRGRRHRSRRTRASRAPREASRSGFDAGAVLSEVRGARLAREARVQRLSATRDPLGVGGAARSWQAPGGAIRGWRAVDGPHGPGPSALAPSPPRRTPERVQRSGEARRGGFSSSQGRPSCERTTATLVPKESSQLGQRSSKRMASCARACPQSRLIRPDFFRMLRMAR